MRTGRKKPCILLRRKTAAWRCKERSPSCGSHFVYDGTFTGTVVPGQGVTAALLAGRGVELFSEETIARLLLLYGPDEM